MRWLWNLYTEQGWGSVIFSLGWGVGHELNPLAGIWGQGCGACNSLFYLPNVSINLKLV